MKLPTLPVFFPDATRAVIKSLDTQDIKNTKTNGILVNTYHLYKDVGMERMIKLGGVKKMMNWKGFVISDSGGFQVGSLIKKNPNLGKVTNHGVTFRLDNKKILLTPELSVEFQFAIGSDMIVVLDDFDAPNATKDQIKESVERTIYWAKRSKKKYEEICEEKKLSKKKRPYLLAVIQGGRDKKLRKYCTEELLKIGFDGFGYGGEEKVKGSINLDLAKFLRSLVPDKYIMYALGVGKPHDVVNMSRIGYSIFDCVLPTRDARHGRLYVYNADSIDKIDIRKKEFYRTINPNKRKYLEENSPVSLACDCLLCKNYSMAYIFHLFKVKDISAFRLATIHNLRFYSILMSKLKKGLT